MKIRGPRPEVSAIGIADDLIIFHTYKKRITRVPTVLDTSKHFRLVNGLDLERRVRRGDVIIIDVCDVYRVVGFCGTNLHLNNLPGRIPPQFPAVRSRQLWVGPPASTRFIVIAPGDGQINAQRLQPTHSSSTT